jgi:hypothetical protein
MPRSPDAWDIPGGMMGRPAPFSPNFGRQSRGGGGGEARRAGAQASGRPLSLALEVFPGTRALRRFQVLAAKLEKGPPLGRAFCVCQTKHEGRVSKGAGRARHKGRGRAGAGEIQFSGPELIRSAPKAPGWAITGHEGPAKSTPLH